MRQPYPTEKQALRRRIDDLEAENTTLRAQLAATQASERERCAKVADAYIAFCDRENAAASYKREAARLIASRIRALSPTPNQEKPE